MRGIVSNVCMTQHGPVLFRRRLRIRSKLENQFDKASGGGSSGDMWTDGLDTSPVDYADSSAPAIDMMGQISSDGYEWLEHGGSNWYRAPHSGQEWTRWG
ncbi:MAG TPA: hypothetical protein QF646_05540 [Candidatus Poseidoniales archaeon]|nr:hypothetical protein [Candidatus Poseidoniales archaeon]